MKQSRLEENRPMLTIFMWAGAVLGFAAGLIHAVQILLTQPSLPGRNSKAMACYRALWAIALWTLFGGYLLLMWIVAVILRPVLGLLARRRRVA